MRRTLCILSCLLALILYTNAYATVEPVITVNGMSGTVNVAADSAVTIRIQLSPGDKAGTDADWWLAGYAYGRWYYYQLSGNWNDIGSSLDFSKLRPVYQGKLFALSASEIFQIPKLSAGDYTMYFGVDMNMNGKLDTDSLVFDTLKLTVNAVINDVYASGPYWGAEFLSDAVKPVITANGKSGTVEVEAGSAVTIGVRLFPGDKAGADADWWLVGYDLKKWYYHTPDGRRYELSDDNVRPIYQGKLFDSQSADLIYIPEFTDDTYILHFGVDMNMNGKMDSMEFDIVKIVKQKTEYPKYYEFPSLTPEKRKQPVIQADKLVDFIPLQNGYGVRVIKSGVQHILRIVPLSDPENGQVISELVLDEDPYSGTIRNGNMLYLFFSDPGFCVFLNDLIKYSTRNKTKIQVIDLSVPQTPVKRGSFELAKTYRPSSDIFQIDGSVLLIPYSGRVLDFSDPDHPKEIADILLSDIRDISRYFMNGRILYVSHYRNTDSGSDYYLSKVDFSDPSAPLQSAPVSIPAPCIGTDPSGRYVFTVGGGFFSSLRLGDDKADLLYKAEIAASDENWIISDGFAYLSTSSVMVIADISNPEKLGFYKYELYYDANKSSSIVIRFVKNRKIFAYVDINKMYGDDVNYIVCYDASNPQSLRVDSFFESSILHGESDGPGILQNCGFQIYQHAFSDDKAYLSLGYYGLWIGSINN